MAKILAKIDPKITILAFFFAYRHIGRLGRIFGRTLSAVFGRIFGIGRTLQILAKSNGPKMSFLAILETEL